METCRSASLSLGQEQGRAHASAAAAVYRYEVLRQSSGLLLVPTHVLDKGQHGLKLSGFAVAESVSRCVHT